MRIAVNVLLFCGLSVLAYSFLSSSFSPLSHFHSSGDLPDRIDDVYLNFDSLRTDLGDYAWPTDASKKMSSAFASFRTIHFHAGIDISTNGRTGYKVFASRDGYVSRISVSPYGYGKMLYVRHNDGFTTVYAHLGGFSRDLEASVREQQYKTGQYGVELKYDGPVFPVSKKEVIAYTGDTGVGPAHFHFEIRDEDMNPLNPLLCPDFGSAITDTRFPELHQVRFSPFDYASRVNGSATPEVQSVRNRGNHKYSLPHIVHLNGLVGLSVEGSDQSNATWQRSNVYHYELSLDGTILFSSTLDRFSAQETEQIAIHYDWPLVQSGEGRFQKLFLEPGNDLPLYSRLPERAGVLVASAFSRGEHQLRIVARDIAGNTSELTGVLYFGDPPSIDVRKTEEQFVLVPQSSSVQSIIVGSKSPGRRSWNLVTYDPSALASTAEGYILPIDSAGPRLLKIVARDDQGSQSYPVFFSSSTSGSSNTSISLKKEFLRDYLLVTISSHLPFTVRPSVWIVDKERKSLLDINATDERTYVGTIPLNSVSGGTIRLEANGTVNGTPVSAFDEFSLFPISPEKGGTIVAGDGEFTINFPPSGVYQPLYCRIEKNEEGYSVLPKDVLLNRGATVYYRIPDSANPAGLGLYRADRGELLSATPEEGAFIGNVKTLLGDFALRNDPAPPLISDLRVRLSGKSVRLTASLRDAGSGIDARSIRLTLDDSLLIAAYDPYIHRIVFDEPFPIQAGSHHMRIEAADRMGNKATAAKSFRTSR